MSEDVLRRLREICLALPDVTEVTAWGHPNFKAGKKTFAVFEKYKGEWAIAFQAELEHQQHLVSTDSRYYVTPYVGKRGWVSLRVAGGVQWKEVKALVANSHRLVTATRPLKARGAASAPRSRR